MSQGPRGALRSFMALLFVALSMLLAACSMNPTTGRPQLVLLDAEEEALIGRTAHPRIVAAYGGAYEEGGIDDYVSVLVARLVASSSQPDLVYTVTVLDSSAVNALALPGGYVYVTRGLLALAGDEAELAGVIAHEIAHVNARHVAQRQTAEVGTSLLGALVGSVLGSTVVDGSMSRGAEGLLASYSQEQESEADRLAVTYLMRAGYDPYAVRDFLRSINAYAAMRAKLVGEAYDPTRVGWLSSHPAPRERIEGAADAAAKIVYKGALQVRGRERYFAAIDGLLYGESRAHGYIREGTFIHAAQRFRFSVPAQFRLTYTPQAVWATGPDKTIVKFDQASKGADQSLEDYLIDDWGAAFVLDDVRSFKIGALSAVSARTRLQGLATRVIAIETSPTQVYRFLVGIPVQVQEAYDSQITDMVESFRTMSVAEATAIRSQRVRIVQVMEGMIVEHLAAQMSFGDARLERFKLLNAIRDEDQLIVGRLVKLIVEAP